MYVEFFMTPNRRQILESCGENVFLDLAIQEMLMEYEIKNGVKIEEKDLIHEQFFYETPDQLKEIEKKFYEKHDISR